MSDKPSNYELDDELLSAYLDGELSADERAAVEARLATDPAAQHLLHELRSVSQSVQALPTEFLGRDLSEEIIRRARETRPMTAAAGIAKTSAVDDRSRSGDTMPKIRIFNSRRAWIWASMALAAGLLIMIVQSGDEPAKKLPPVAARSQEGAQIQPADEVGQPVRRELSLSDAAKPSSPSPAAVAVDDGVYEKVDALGTAMPAAEKPGEGGSGRSSGVTRNGAAASPPVATASPAPKLQIEREKIMLNAGDASSTITAAPGEVAFDKRPDSPQPTGGLSASGSLQVIAAEKQKSESIAIPYAQRFVVVSVVAKPEALKNSSFERLLADNKIEFVPQPAQNGPRSFGGGNLPTAVKNERVLKNQVSKKVEGRAVDMVLVEAPAPVVESCLAQLNKNESDFLSIDVKEEQQFRDRFDAKSTPAKKLAETSKNLSRFNRGTSPPDRKDTVDIHKWYYDFNKSSEFAADGSSRAGGPGGEASATSGAEQDASGNKKLSYQVQPGSEVRRARRIETWGITSHQAGEPASPELAPKSPVGRAAGIQSGAKTLNQSMSQRAPSEQAEAKADSDGNDLKVLFVFTSAEGPTPSAPPDNRPK